MPSCRRSQAVRVGGELRTDDEQLALEAQDEVGDPGQPRRHHVELLLEAELGAGEPEGGHGLVDRAVGLGPRVVLGDPLAAVEEAGRAVVALAGRDGRVEAGTRAPRPVGHRALTT